MDQERGDIVNVNDPLTLEQEVLARLRPFGAKTGIHRIVVPSESLRLHWVRQIASSQQATVGIEVCTHQRLAQSVVETRGLVFVNRRAWVAEVVREVAQSEATLNHVLSDLADGYGLVVRQVFELMDAGLTDAHGGALAERAMSLTSIHGIASGVAARIGALLRVACRTERIAREAGVCTTPLLFEHATDSVCVHSEAQHRVGGSIFVGFSDATGRLADFISACHRFAGASVALECPPSPVSESEVETGVAFADAFRARFDGPPRREVGLAGRRKAIRYLEAADPFAEARSVAEWCSELIEDGNAPESIGVVARNLQGWVHPVSEAFRERGVPFSGLSASLVGARTHRRAHAAAAVLERCGKVSAGVWLDACDAVRRDGLRLALDCRGVRTLEEAQAVDSGRVRTGVVHGLVEGRSGPRLETVRVPVDTLVRAKHAASRLIRLLEEWPERAGRSDFRRAATEVLVGQLGMPSASPAVESALAALDAIPEGVEVPGSGAIRMLTDALRQAGAAPIGGAGGGVALLSATEARGRTFEALFVVGLNRGEFPRIVAEDPLFPDAARRHLRDLLPDLRSRMDGLLEERFLFAQLMNSSSVVWLSNSHLGQDGGLHHPSSLLVELQLSGRIPAAPERVAGHHRMAWREAINRGVQGAEVSEVFSLVGGSYRTAVPKDKAKAGADFGYIGPVRSGLDPRGRVRYITFIEQVAKCPWSAFLRRMLGVGERPGTASDLPSASNHLVGLAVHKVIERMVEHALDDSTPETSRSTPWPDPDLLEQWAEEEVQGVLREQGVGLRGFNRAVVPPVLEALQLLRAMDESLESVVGGEVEVSWTPAVGPTLHARADRIERRAGTELVTDLKLGKPPTDHKRESTRREKTVGAVRRGEMLQGPLYARSAEGSMGRYLYVNPGLDLPQREFSFSAEDPETSEAMDRIVAEVNEVLRLGTMFPRVSEAVRDRKPSACSSCRVREACAVEDSSLRGAVMNAAVAEDSSDEGRALTELWFRGDAR